MSSVCSTQCDPCHSITYRAAQTLHTLSQPTTEAKDPAETISNLSRTKIPDITHPVMLLAVHPLTRAQLVFLLRPHGSLQILLLHGPDLFLLGVADSQHTETAIGTRYELLSSAFALLSGSARVLHLLVRVVATFLDHTLVFAFGGGRVVA